MAHNVVVKVYPAQLKTSILYVPKEDHKVLLVKQVLPAINTIVSFDDHSTLSSRLFQIFMAETKLCQPAQCTEDLPAMNTIVSFFGNKSDVYGINPLNIFFHD